MQLTNWVLQRIAKTGNKVEHIAELECSDFKVFLSGFGTYIINKTIPQNSYANLISGNFAGYTFAPFYTEDADCVFCGDIGIDEQTTAAPICVNGVCNVDNASEFTPFFGTYTLKYNSTKSNNCVKKGLTAKSLGIPNYVNIY